MSPQVRKTDLQGAFGVLGPQPPKFGPADPNGAIAFFREHGFAVIEVPPCCPPLA